MESFKDNLFFSHSLSLSLSLSAKGSPTGSNVAVIVAATTSVGVVIVGTVVGVILYIMWKKIKVVDAHSESVAQQLLTDQKGNQVAPQISGDPPPPAYTAASVAGHGGAIEGDWNKIGPEERESSSLGFDYRGRIVAWI